jgi:hypothetical protein
MDNHEANTLEQGGSESMENIWPQLRRLLVFQIKLYIDAFRDLFLSALSLGAFIIDLVQQNSGPDCYFEKVLRFGRKTEVTINLFNQYARDEQSGTTVDSILQEVEERVREQAERSKERAEAARKEPRRNEEAERDSGQDQDESPSDEESDLNGNSEDTAPQEPPSN